MEGRKGGLGEGRKNGGDKSQGRGEERGMRSEGKRGESEGKGEEGNKGERWRRDDLMCTYWVFAANSTG